MPGTPRAGDFAIRASRESVTPVLSDRRGCMDTNALQRDASRRLLDVIESPQCGAGARPWRGEEDVRTR